MRKIAVFGAILFVLSGCGGTTGDEKLEIQPPSCDTQTVPAGLEEVGTFTYGPAATNVTVSDGLELIEGHIKNAEIGLDLHIYPTDDQQTVVRNYSDYEVTVQWGDGCVQTLISENDRHGLYGVRGSGTATLYKPVG